MAGAVFVGARCLSGRGVSVMRKVSRGVERKTRGENREAWNGLGWCEIVV